MCCHCSLGPHWRGRASWILGQTFQSHSHCRSDGALVIRKLNKVLQTMYARSRPPNDCTEGACDNEGRNRQLLGKRHLCHAKGCSTSEEATAGTKQLSPSLATREHLAFSIAQFLLTLCDGLHVERNGVIYDYLRPLFRIPNVGNPLLNDAFYVCRSMICRATWTVLSVSRWLRVALSSPYVDGAHDATFGRRDTGSHALDTIFFFSLFFILSFLYFVSFRFVSIFCISIFEEH